MDLQLFSANLFPFNKYLNCFQFFCLFRMHWFLWSHDSDFMAKSERISILSLNWDTLPILINSFHLMSLSCPVWSSCGILPKLEVIQSRHFWGMWLGVTAHFPRLVQPFLISLLSQRPCCAKWINTLALMKNSCTGFVSPSLVSKLWTAWLLPCPERKDKGKESHWQV